MTRSLRWFIGSSIAFVAGAAVACSDPTRAVATLPTIADTTVVYALNGTPRPVSSAIALFDGATVRVDVTFNFDVAFDLDANGNVVVIPVRKLSVTGGGHQVSMQVVPGTYESVSAAPKSGFTRDSSFVVAPGAVLVVESANPSVCSLYSVSPYFYSKLTVTSVNLATRQIGVAFTVDRNCSFRSFDPGIPNS